MDLSNVRAGDTVVVEMKYQISKVQEGFVYRKTNTPYGVREYLIKHPIVRIEKTPPKNGDKVVDTTRCLEATVIAFFEGNCWLKYDNPVYEDQVVPVIHVQRT